MEGEWNRELISKTAKEMDPDVGCVIACIGTGCPIWRWWILKSYCEFVFVVKTPFSFILMLEMCLTPIKDTVQ